MQRGSRGEGRRKLNAACARELPPSRRRPVFPDLKKKQLRPVFTDGGSIRQPAKSWLIPERTLTMLNMVLPPYHKIGSSTHTLHFEITFDFVDNHACIMPVHFF